MEVPARGKLNPSFHGQYADAHPDDDDVVDGQVVDVDDAPAAAAELDTGETPPRRPPGATGGLRGLMKKKIGGGRARRVSLEQVCASGWMVLASLAGQSGMTPTGRVLTMQAPVAGVILEDALKGTIADKVLQPLARSAAKGSEVSALLGPPVLVSILHTRPQLAPQLLPVLRMTLRQWVMVAGPAMKAAQKREAKAIADLGLDEDTDLNAMIDGMLETFFSPPDMAAEVPDAA